MVALCTFAQILLSLLSLVYSQRCWGWGVKIKCHIKKKKRKILFQEKVTGELEHWHFLELQLSGFN